MSTHGGEGIGGGESELAGLAGALGAASVGLLSAAERALLAGAPRPERAMTAALGERIRAGEDPLGDAFCALRSPEERRRQGAVYTPPAIVDSMLAWAADRGEPARVVDPGSGSGRFLLAAGRRFPGAALVGVEKDPLAALLARANLAAAGLAGRAQIRVEDFRAAKLAPCDGPTLFAGNPPYVRHHGIEPEWKAWLKREARALGLAASALAGLHVHFVLAIARRARPGDAGVLITAAEWLDVNYGRLVRELFTHRLGGRGVVLIEPRAEPFPGTATTAAITTFEIDGRAPAARFARVRRLEQLGDLSRGRRVARERLAAAPRWSVFTRPARKVPAGWVELGELFRVHRGQATGANRVWIARDHAPDLPPQVLFATVTRARELLEAGAELSNASSLRRVIDLPADLSSFTGRERRAIESFLARAEAMGARASYLARHRQPWWSIRLRAPAPILATYMARRPPAFVLNSARVRHLNVAHGLYPREPLSLRTLSRLTRFLRRHATTDDGRIYAGGLAKFEPRDMERIPIPRPSGL